MVINLQDDYQEFQPTLMEIVMKTYNQQIEDAYTGSKRQGDMMRNRNIEFSSGQDRKNRYRDDLYQYPPQPRPFYDHNQYDDQRTDRYGYERSSLYETDGRREMITNEGNTRNATYGPHRGKGPRNYKRSDEKIREDVIDRLTDDLYIDASEIEVSVQSCEVTLTGHVDDKDAKRRAEDIVESVSGVTNVENKLKVQPADDSRGRDQRKGETQIRSEATA
jgi:hypothetical protein